MKILIFSDSHGKIKHMDKVFKKHMDITTIFFLGDFITDCNGLFGSDISLYAVPGNCDFSYNSSTEKTLKIEDKRIWLTHGDGLGVKNSYDMLIISAKQRKADICCFGHTHIADSFFKDGIHFINPGSCSYPRGRLGASYAVLELTPSEVLVKIIEI